MLPASNQLCHGQKPEATHLSQPAVYFICLLYAIRQAVIATINPLGDLLDLILANTFVGNPKQAVFLKIPDRRFHRIFSADQIGIVHNVRHAHFRCKAAIVVTMRELQKPSPAPFKALAIVTASVTVNLVG